MASRHRPKGSSWASLWSDWALTFADLSHRPGAPTRFLSMSMAKDLLRRRQAGIAEVAERVGYSSASTFNVAFTRRVGVPPGRYARKQSQS